MIKIKPFLCIESLYQESRRKFHSDILKLKNFTRGIDMRGKQVVDVNMRRDPGVFLRAQIFVMLITQMLILHPFSLLQNKKWKSTYSQLAILIDSSCLKILSESKNSSSS
jgi:hypothetical protein